MSKVVDLTGLSLAISKLKAWVNSILDWNANEGQDGYIKNRTHYAYEKQYQISGSFLASKPLVTTTGVVTEEYKEIFLKVTDRYGDIILDTTLKAIGEEYTTAQVDSVIFSIDTGAGLDMIRLDVYDPNGDIQAAYGNFTVKYGVVKKKLDEAYIPDTIARKSDIYNAITNTLNTEV
jgi:hypothetical protein